MLTTKQLTFAKVSIQQIKNGKIPMIRMLSLLFFLAAFTTSFGYSQDKVTINLDSLRCNKQNEKDKPPFKESDEIFVLVAFRGPDGNTGFKRLPGTGHWRMRGEGNDEKWRKQNNHVLWEGKLAKGQTVDLIITIVEEDHVRVKEFEPGSMKHLVMQLAKLRDNNGDANQEQNEGWIIAFKELLDFIITVAKGNKDDHIATFSARIRRSNKGEIIPYWAPVLDCKKTDHRSPDPNVGMFDAHGSGSQYNVWVSPWIKRK